MTAYGSITKIGKPKAGETVFISGASGVFPHRLGCLQGSDHAGYDATYMHPAPLSACCCAADTGAGMGCNTRHQYPHVLLLHHLRAATAGAVGMVVADMCKNVYGCRVVGSCGSDEKVGAHIGIHGTGAVFWRSGVKEQHCHALGQCRGHCRARAPVLQCPCKPCWPG